MPDLVKIGFTESDVKQRAVQLSAPTGIPMPFVVVGFVETPWPREVESEVHQKLGFLRLNEKEFFRATPSEINGTKTDEDEDNYFLMMITHAAQMVELRKREEDLRKEYEEMRIRHVKVESELRWDNFKTNYPEKYQKMLEQIRERQST